MTSSPLKLTELRKDEGAIITGFVDEASEITIRLREIGFAEGDNVMPLHFGLFGRNPMTVRVNGAGIALRRKDASVITVSRQKHIS